MISKIKRVSSLDAEEVAVRSALIAIIATNNLHARIRAAHPQSRLAAIPAMRADGADMLHLPGTRLIAIRPGSKRPHRANVDAHAALFALQMVSLIRRDDRTNAAVLHSQRPNVHALTADTHAAVTKDASWTIEEHHRRPLLLILMILGLHELRFGLPIGECHVLQFALAAGIAHRTIQRMISQQKFDHGLARPCD